MHQRCLDGFEPFGVALDKRGVDPVFLQHLPTEPTKERLISTQTHGKMKVGQFRPVSDQTADSLRVLEADQPCFRKRVYGDDMGAAPFHFFQRRQHAGGLVPGFWPTTMTRSVTSKSSKVTEPFPMPMASCRATLVGSWHILEQSGRLFVPKARASN